MKALVVGGTGLIGLAVSKALKKLNWKVVTASANHGDIIVDISSTDSIVEMYKNASDLDAIVCTAGSVKEKGPLSKLTIESFQKAMTFKAWGQMNLVLLGQKHLKPYGSFTLTTGILSTGAFPKTSTATVVNQSVEGFVKSAALELENNQRINAVSPTVISEALSRYGDTFAGHKGITASDAAEFYIRAIYGQMNGETLCAW